MLGFLLFIFFALFSNQRVFSSHAEQTRIDSVPLMIYLQVRELKLNHIEEYIEGASITFDYTK